MEQSRCHGDLTAEEVRVLGCLIEKESTTPVYYPLTLNGLRTACNQSTSRDPVVSYADHDIERALDSLRERGLTRTVHSTSNRATKYRHVVPEALGLDAGQTAAMSVLMLRGPQTVGELKSRTERQHHFDSTDAVAAVLAELAARPEPLALRLERRPGQKDARWVHLMSGQIEQPESVAVEPPDSGRAGSDDPYGGATAEFYDLLAAGRWENFGIQLLVLLSDVDPAVGPIVDVGAGSGVGLPYLHVAVPDARIYAVEPSQAMRTVLHARLAIDPELRQITTLDPRPFCDAALPERACALVASAALGHLTTVERTRLWRYVAEQMPAGAPAVVELLAPGRPLTVPAYRYGQVSVGDFVYEGWQQGEPADEHHMVWTMTYKVLDGETVIADHTERSESRCFDADDIGAEIEPYGLTLDEHEDCVVISSVAISA